MVAHVDDLRCSMEWIVPPVAGRTLVALPATGLGDCSAKVRETAKSEKTWLVDLLGAGRLVCSHQIRGRSGRYQRTMVSGSSCRTGGRVRQPMVPAAPLVVDGRRVVVSRRRVNDASRKAAGARGWCHEFLAVVIGVLVMGKLGFGSGSFWWESGVRMQLDSAESQSWARLYTNQPSLVINVWGSGARSWRMELVRKVLLNDGRRFTLVGCGSCDARVSGIPAASGTVDCLRNTGALGP